MDEAALLLERGIVAEEEADALIGHLRAVFKADGVVLASGHGFGPWFRADRVPEPWIAAHQSMIEQDESGPTLAEAPLGTVYMVESDRSPLQARTELYQHFRRYFADAIIAHLHSPVGEPLTFVIYRPSGQRRFSEHDRRAMRLLVPHLTFGLGARTSLAALSLSGAETMARVEISLPKGTFEWSRSAEDLMRRQLSGFDRAARRRVEQMILVASGRFHVADLGGRSQRLIGGLRIEFSGMPPRPFEKRRLLGLLIDDRPGTMHPEAPALSLLSPRLRQVALLLAAGLTIKQVAGELSLAEETARGYVKEIYVRLGIHNRAELVGTLGLLPSSR